MRRILASICLLLQIAFTMSSALPSFAYWINPQIFAAVCENKDRPNLHCCGRCKLRRANAAALGVGSSQSLSAPRDVQLPSGESWLDRSSATSVSLALAFQPPRGEEYPLHRASSPELPPPKA